MATTIGVYDSGIGGLTTLSVLMRRFPECDFRYYADNARMPFGTKSADEVRRAVRTAIDDMSGECSRIVLGCNTASVTANPDGAVKLRPHLDGFEPSSTLLLATPLTLAGLRAKERGFLTADTRELAVLVEITASLKTKSRLKPDMSGLSGYLSEKLPREGVKRVVLGCSHYVYLEKQIAEIYPEIPLSDGNADVLTEVARGFARDCPLPSRPPETDAAERVRAPQSGRSLPEEKFAPAGCFDDEKAVAAVYRVKFSFTGEREDKKYRWMLLHLLKTYAVKFEFPAI